MENKEITEHNIVNKGLYFRSISSLGYWKR
jgi:hypothetical protein